MITGWDYTPTPFWGAFAKEALSGKQFELKKKYGNARIAKKDAVAMAAIW